MRHDIHIEGCSFRLRPIGDSDASFVVELRSNSELNRFLHTGALDVESQISWFQEYYERANDYYFVIERNADARPEGVISIYDILGGHGEWGRWILLPGSLAAVESAWLIYRGAFEYLDLDSLYCRTVAVNEKVVSFHDSCGITSRKLLPNHFELGGQLFDAIEHRVDRLAWIIIESRLEKLAKALARRTCHD